MAGILVFVEQRKGKVRAASLQAVSEARRLAAGPVTAVVAGSGIAADAASLGAYGRPECSWPTTRTSPSTRPRAMPRW